MEEVGRRLEMNLPRGQSAFLWGPRKTGKSTWLRRSFPLSVRYDLLKTDVFLRLAKEPFLLREELLAVDEKLLKHPVIVDEVQKVPRLLDEVHLLIEEHGLQFILCGSSARKLKHGQANMLGGRAWRFEMFPLTFDELRDFDLLRAINNGLLPSHYFTPQPRRALKSYVEDYLTQEIMAEGLVRNLPSFARFLDAIGFSHGELTNYANIARDCGVDAKTVRSYYEILEDTLLGSFVAPFSSSRGRQSITSAEKFYLCDTGVAGFLCNRKIESARGVAFGHALEHFILMELRAHSAYSALDYKIKFWRTKSGYEVDFVLGDGDIAIEVKGASRVDRKEFRGIKAFREEFKPRKAIVVCNEDTPRLHDEVHVMPWREFLIRLWSGGIID